MFLSRVSLADTPSAGSLFHMLAGRLDAYDSHRLVWALFGDDPNAQRSFVYRYDQKRGRPELMIVSAREPVDNHNLFHIETKPYAPDLRAGDSLTFMARINPVWRKEVDGKRRKVDVVMDEVHRTRADHDGPVDRLEAAGVALPAWFAAQADRGGFALEEGSLVVDAYGRHRFRTRDGGDVTVGGVDLHGAVRVTDPDAFQEVLFQGLGASRAFGFGLMLVRRK